MIEMGARRHLPRPGRFIEIDPVEGGSCSDYDCVCAYPINKTDPDGAWWVFGHKKNGSCRGPGVVKAAGRTARSASRFQAGRRVASGAATSLDVRNSGRS